MSNSDERPPPPSGAPLRPGGLWDCAPGMGSPARHGDDEAVSRRLEQALARMRFRVEPEPFRLIALPPGASFPPLPPPAMVVREPGETTVLAAERVLSPLAGRPDTLDAGRFRWITFEAPMGWEVVGFLALVSAHLARAGVPIGCVASHRRDHLFIAETHLERARSALRALFPESAASEGPPSPGSGEATL